MKDESIYLAMLAGLDQHELGELIGKEIQRRKMWGVFLCWDNGGQAVSTISLPEALRLAKPDMTITEELYLVAAFMEGYEEQRKMVFPPPQDEV